MILAVVAFIAGKPVHVVCDPALGGHYIAGAAAATPYGGDTIYAIPEICADAAARVGSYEFALAVSRFIHEASHARGLRVEACAELTADLGIYQVLRDYYRIPFFTPMSRQIGAQVLEDVTRLLPAAYQPEGCWGVAPG